MIRFTVGDATRPAAAGPIIIAHICNDIGRWGKGFVTALSRRWKTPERAFRDWFQSEGGFGLGELQLVEVEPSLWVANMVAQPEAEVHMPRIGAGLAGGDWNVIEELISKKLAGVSVVVYDLG